MNKVKSIKNKIKFGIPNYQFGGNSFFSQFSNIIPKLGQFQGQTNGESNLYSPEAQNYYGNLVYRNWLSSRGITPDQASFDYNPTNPSKYLDPNYYPNNPNEYIDPVTGQVPVRGVDPNRDTRGGNIDKSRGNALGTDPSVITEGPLDAIEANQADRQAQYNKERNKAFSNQAFETGANIMSLVQGQEAYDAKPKEVIRARNTGSYGTPYMQLGGKAKNTYDNFINNISYNEIAKTLPKTTKAYPSGRKAFDKAGDQLVYDLSQAPKNKKLAPIIEHIANKGIDKKLAKIDKDTFKGYIDEINKIGFAELGNISDYKGLYEKFKKHTGITSTEAKDIFAKAIENEGFMKRTALKTAISPFLQKGGSFVNNTGYTVGTSTYDNPFNIIPNGNITTENTDIFLKAKPNNGPAVILEPGKNYNFKNADYVTEIPIRQFGGQSNPKYSYQSALEDGMQPMNNVNEFMATGNAAGYSPNIVSLPSKRDIIQEKVQQLAPKGVDPESITNAITSNKGYDWNNLDNIAATKMMIQNSMGDPSIQHTRPEDESYPLSKDNPHLRGIAIKGAANNSKLVFTKNGDPYEYKSVNGNWVTRKRGSKDWIKVTDPTMSDKISEYFSQGDYTMRDYGHDPIKSKKKSTNSRSSNYSTNIPSIIKLKVTG